MLVFIVFNTIGFVCAILGGHSIDIEDAPYQVNYGDICGGVLISRRWVLTTAHCGKKDYVRVGSRHRLRGSQVSVTSHHVHPKYQRHHKFDYDLQLLELKRRLHLCDKVRGIGISEHFGRSVVVAGWGYSEEKGDYAATLQQVRVEIQDIEKCQNVDREYYNHTLTERMFCAGGLEGDACQGDSGSGAISDGFLVGISSFGYGCGRNIPGVYINVTDHKIRDWIRNVSGIIKL